MFSTPQFPASWGGIVPAVTAVSTLLLLGLPVAMYLATPTLPGWVFALGVAAPIALIIGAGLYMVAGYSVEGRTLYIHRLYFRTAVDLGSAPEAAADPDALRGSLRLWGNGGLFAVTGWYRSHHLGRFRAWVTDPARCVVIRAGSRTYVVSPQETEPFLAAVAASGRDVT